MSELPKDLFRRAASVVDRRAPLGRALRRTRDAAGRWQHAAFERWPSLVRPRPRQLTIAITAQCNLRCVGCRYGRDFMPGARLSLELVQGALDDAVAAGIATVATSTNTQRPACAQFSLEGQLARVLAERSDFCCPRAG